MAQKRITFFGVPLTVDCKAEDSFPRMLEANSATSVALIGPDAWALAEKLPGYADKLNQMSVTIPNGLGISLACRLMTHEACSSATFDMTDLARSFFTYAVENNISLALMGGHPRDDEDAKDKLVYKFQGLQVVDTSHGYGDFEPKIAAIVAKAPQAVLVSIESPRQEDFILALREAGYKGFILGCGTFFEHYATSCDYMRYPEWVDAYRLAPLYKLYKEPMQMWKVICSYNAFGRMLMTDIAKRLKKKGDEKLRNMSQHTADSKP